MIAVVNLKGIMSTKSSLMIKLCLFSRTSIHQQYTALQAYNSIVINNSLMSSLLIHNKFWSLIACYGFDLDHSLWSMKWFLQVTRIQQLNCTHTGSDLLNLKLLENKYKAKIIFLNSIFL